MEKKADTVIIYSGGLDSTVLLTAEKMKDKKKIIHALNFNYGSKHNEQERKSAQKICDILGVKLVCIDMKFIGELFSSDLLKSGGEIPEGHYAADNMKSTVVPFRNGIMLSIAVGYAESVGANKVLLASHSGDHFIYPDCRPEFTSAMSTAAKNGTFAKVKIQSPFAKLTKAGIVALGIKCHAPMVDAYSCYNGQEKPCLKCGTCVERTEAFLHNNIQDPALSKEQWNEAVNIYSQTMNKNLA